MVYFFRAFLVSITLLITNQSRADETTIVPAKIKKFIIVPGKITDNPNKSAHLSPRYSGLVNKVFVKSGEVVKKGAPLAQINRNIGISNYILKSPISGTVTQRKINPGDSVHEDQEAFRISDLKHVWVTMHVKEDILPDFKLGQKISIHSRADKNEIDGEVVFISPIVDPGTRTSHVAVSLENHSNFWRPGKIVDGYLFKKEVSVPLAIPTSAIKFELGRAFTFRKQKDLYVKTYLRLGLKDNNYAEILAGMQLNSIVTADPPKVDHDDHHDDSHENHSDHEGHKH